MATFSRKEKIGWGYDPIKHIARNWSGPAYL
jgi:hypothetical protein